MKADNVWSVVLLLILIAMTVFFVVKAKSDLAKLNVPVKQTIVPKCVSGHRDGNNTFICEKYK